MNELDKPSCFRSFGKIFVRDFIDRLVQLKHFMQKVPSGTKSHLYIHFQKKFQKKQKRQHFGKGKLVTTKPANPYENGKEILENLKPSTDLRNVDCFSNVSERTYL